MTTPVAAPLDATASATATATASTASTPPLAPEQLQPDQPPFELSSTPFRGKTLLATQLLRPGDLILTERPLFVLPPHSPLRPANSRCPSEPGVGAILAALKRCSVEDREAFMALGNSFKGKRAMQGWIEAGLLEGREGEDEALKVMGIWLTNRQGAFHHGSSAIWKTFSRINHSCQPNCRFNYGDTSALDPLVLHAVRPLSPGDELTISYTDVLNVHFFRTLLLKENYDFRCTCPTCTLPPTQLAESDDNRKRLKEFPDIVERWKAGKTSGKAVLMEGVEIFRKGGVFDQEGLLGGQPRSYYWHLLFVVAAAHAALAEASTYARRFLVDWLIENGPAAGDQTARIEMEGFARDPKSARMWGSRLPEPLDPSLDFGGGGGELGGGERVSSEAMELDMEGEGAGEGAKKKKKKKKKKSKKGKAAAVVQEGEGEMEVEGEEASSDKEGDSSVAPTPALLSEPSTPSTPLLDQAAVVNTTSTLETSISAAPVPPSPSAAVKLTEGRATQSTVEQLHLLTPTPQNAPSTPPSVPLPLSSPPTPSPAANASTSPIVALRDSGKGGLSSSPTAPAPLSESPPPSPPASAPTFDPSLSIIAAPPVSVDISKDELTRLAAARAAKDEQKKVETVIDAEGEWEKWPDEALQGWSTVGGKKENGVGEKEVVPAADPSEEQQKEFEYHEDEWGPPATSRQPDWEAPPFPTPPRPQPATTSASSNSPHTWRRPSTQTIGLAAPLPPPPKAFAPILPPHEKPRSKATQRKATRKLKSAEAAATAAASAPPKYTPGLPRAQPSTFAELVTPAPRPSVDRTRPSPPTTSLPRFPLSTSSSGVTVSLPPTPDLSDLPATGWIRKSPITTTPKNLAPPPPDVVASPQPAPTSSSLAETQEGYKPITLATSAFLRRPTPPSESTSSTSKPASATAERLPSPTTPRSISALPLVEEHEEEPEQLDVEQDVVGSLGLGLGAGPLGQLDDEDEDNAEGDRFEDADEEDESSAGESVIDHGSPSGEVEGIEEKMKRMVGAGEGKGDKAFEDAEEEGGALEGLGISLGGQDLPGEENPTSFARPGNSRKKSVRFEHADQQEAGGRSPEEELPPPPLEWTNAQDQPSANAENSFRSPSLPPSPPESPSQSRHAAAALLEPPSRLPPFLRTDSAPSPSEPPPSNQHPSSSISALAIPPPPPAAASPTPPRSSPSVGEVVEEWLSSTQDWEKRASQRRNLIAILNEGQPLALAAERVPLPPSRHPSPPPPPSPPSTSDHAALSTPTRSSSSDLSVPRVQVEAPTPPPSAPPVYSASRYVLPSRSRQGLIEIRPETIELAKLERTLELLGDEDRRVVKANLDRVKEYPRSLPLSRSWTLFFTDSSHIHRHSNGYDVKQTALFTASSVATLCGSLKGLSSKLSSPGYPRRPIAEALKPGTSLAFFLEGAEPTWEDEWNQQGGRLLLVPPKNRFDGMFERLIFLLAGSSLEQLILEQPATFARFDEAEGTLVGVVANRRLSGQPDRVELWVAGGRKRSKPSKGWLARLKKVLCEELLVDEDSLRFKRHGS